ncbi:MAG: DUF1003 domain-containing protein [Candidatus Cloacimonetes bacterium]|nr:DUF1003 domain-containing protein [Candidatus Cloacimonadota bacterium]MDD3236365.1 DUF1003 domain-containing protein [Candidatus Cloacimonadota bacterium]
MNNYHEIASKLLKKSVEKMNATEKHVLQHLQETETISRNINTDIEEKLTFGQKIADKVAAFGGSWPFIIIFLCVLVAWISLNVLVALNHQKPFDPYPFILLNLVLSMLAALQAPVIMMSQNRQSAHDRIDANHDYEVNLKAELEIIALHQKIDELRDQQWQQLMGIQQLQLEKLLELEKALKKEQ